uniref:PCI domain-containing protein n=1 Tax=Steinernema glaseri TaxID=37863 RepID=A0A1I8AF50_9BILA
MSKIRRAASEAKIGNKLANHLRDLKALHGSVCPNPLERYDIFKRRDNILQQVRKEELGKDLLARVVEGTCASFCSEKERYRRIVQNAVHAYECDERGAPNPAKFITEYSRSAADQEHPLPHELRPAQVLQATMNYILRTMADGHVTPQEAPQWYDFVWSRTRAIRKELTQQKIISDVAVDILEKCCRIHIYAAHQFCEVDPGAFDQRMNTENLSKCLQSLRHMYEDLAKRNIFLESETEFRCYDVLLNIGDSNILQQMYTLRREVRESEAMKWAVQVFLAFNTNNYVKFFQLVFNEATYLEGCLLHRFFFEVRANALIVISSAYYYSRKYPLSSLSTLLAFDDEDDALKFISLFGLSLHKDDPANIEIRKDVEVPAQILNTTKWINAITEDSLFTVLAGSASPNAVSSPTIADSFDSDHRYVNDPVMEDALARLQSSAPPSPNHEAADGAIRPLIGFKRTDALKNSDLVKKGPEDPSAFKQQTVFSFNPIKKEQPIAKPTFSFCASKGPEPSLSPVPASSGFLSSAKPAFTFGNGAKKRAYLECGSQAMLLQADGLKAGEQRMEGESPHRLPRLEAEGRLQKAKAAEEWAARQKAEAEAAARAEKEKELEDARVAAERARILREWAEKAEKEKVEQAQRAQKEEEARIEQITSSVFTSVFASVTENTVSAVRTEIIRNSQEEKLISEMVPNMTAQLCGEVVLKGIDAICSRTFKSTVTDVLRDLKNISEQILITRLKERVIRYAMFWKDRMMASLAKRRRLERINGYLENARNGVVFEQPAELGHVGPFYADPLGAIELMNQIMRRRTAERRAMNKPIIREIIHHWRKWAREQRMYREWRLSLPPLPDFKFGMERNCMKPFTPKPWEPQQRKRKLDNEENEEHV